MPYTPPNPTGTPTQVLWADSWQNQTAFRQMKPGEGSNNHSYSSGCGPTAWLNLVGWHNLNYTPGLLEGFPTVNDEYTNALTMKLLDALGTHDSFPIPFPGDWNDQGFTHWDNMERGYRFVVSHLGYDCHHDYRADWADTNEEWVFKVADRAIRAKRPFIVGYDQDKHYAIGYAIAYYSNRDPQILVNPEWGSRLDKWIPMGTIFGVWAAYDYYAVTRAQLKHGSNSAPAIAARHSDVLLALRGKREERINFLTSKDGRTYGNRVRSAEKTIATPGLAVLDGFYWVAWTGTDGNHSLNVMRSYEGKNWQSKQTLKWGGKCGPVICGHKGKLYIAWRGKKHDKINVIRGQVTSSGGVIWSGRTATTETTESAPALASFDGHLWLAWRGRNNDLVNVARLTDGFGVQNKKTFEFKTPASPALTEHTGVLYLVFRGRGRDHTNILFSENGTSWSSRSATAFKSSEGVSATSFLDNLHIAWNGKGDKTINVRIQRGLPNAPYRPRGLWEPAVLHVLSNRNL